MFKQLLVPLDGSQPKLHCLLPHIWLHDSARR